MTRAEAEALVAPHVVMIAQYQAVPHDAARELLGGDRFARLLADRVRCHGPTRESGRARAGD